MVSFLVDHELSNEVLALLLDSIISGLEEQESIVMIDSFEKYGLKSWDNIEYIGHVIIVFDKRSLTTLVSIWLRNLKLI